MPLSAAAVPESHIVCIMPITNNATGITTNPTTDRHARTEKTVNRTRKLPITTTEAAGPVQNRSAATGESK